MKIMFAVLAGLFVLGFVLLHLNKEKNKKTKRKVSFDDLSPKQKRYVLKRIREKQRKENK